MNNAYKVTIHNYKTDSYGTFEISEETANEIMKIFGNKIGTKLSDIEVGETFKLAGIEFIVLKHLDETATAVISKDIVCNKSFGANNNYDGSKVDKVCSDIEKKLVAAIGKENIYPHDIDLIAANGMKDYGTIERKVTLLALEALQTYGDVLAKHPLNKWWWLATAIGTPTWGTENYAFCVAPSGNISSSIYNNDNGVRPFCILNSNIFVSN